MFPKLLHELPEIIHLLDQGETVHIDKISDSALRIYLQDLLKDLFSLNRISSSSKGVTELLQSTFQSSSVSKKVSDMNAGETLAYRSGIPRVLRLVETFPELRSELPDFFDNLLEEGSVDLSGLSNTDIREELVALLVSLGLHLDQQEEEGEVYSLPDADDDAAKRDAIETCLQLINHVFEVASSYQSLVPTTATTFDSSHVKEKKESKKSHKKEKKEKKEKKKEKKQSKESKKRRIDEADPNLNTLDSSSDDGDSDDDDSGDINAESEGAKPRVIGPAAPPPCGVASSSAMAALGNNPDDEDDDDEDSIGPAPASTDPSSSQHRAVSAYSRLLTSHPTATFAELDNTSALGDSDMDPRWLAAQQYEEHISDVPAEREEWMMEIGENKVLAGMGAFGTTRKFQAGKLAKKAAQQYSEMKARQEALSGGEGNKVRDELEKMRGPSLMETHRKMREENKADLQIKSRAPGALGGSSGEAARRPFDREKDVLTSRKMNDKQVSELMEHAKELGSRFDRGSFQRSV